MKEHCYINSVCTCIPKAASDIIKMELPGARFEPKMSYILGRCSTN